MRLAYLYLASAALKRYHDEGKTTANYGLVRWSVELCLYRIQEALLGVLENLPNRPAAWLLERADLSARRALPATRRTASVRVSPATFSRIAKRARP